MKTKKNTERTDELEKLLVLDFGAQYAHLICRRVRELGVYCELVPFDITPDEIQSSNAKGLIFSGGPKSVLSRDAPLPRKDIYNLGIPILGICYGLQAIVHQRGGEVARAERKEYGKSLVKLKGENKLFRGIEGEETICWMSHGDAALSLPPGFQSIASSTNSPYAAISSGNLYAVQFHPEVTHTQNGTKILANFAFDICGCEKNWSPEFMIDEVVSDLKAKIGPNEKVICGLSGGVDSATTAALLQKAIGDRLVCVFVDHGLLREGERERVEKAFRKTLGKNLVTVDASSRFLRALKGVSDPEKKRRIVGREFIRVFARESKKLGKTSTDWLAQGTLYTDIVESARAQSRKESRIKSHHNVGGLPRELGFRLIEPLKDLYKDEVRVIAHSLGLPNEIVQSHPFPGPGLAVRIIGKVTPEKLKICRQASAIVEDELASSGLYNSVWQAYALVGDDMATGVQGDERKVGHIVTIRIVQSTDAMTADWVRVPYDLLQKMSDRITNEVPLVTWVTYAVSSKPPSTIEPQ